jgi:hypothetical protein
MVLRIMSIDVRLPFKATLRMCLNDDDCQLVLIGIDPALPVYLDDLRSLSAVMSTAKMVILGNMSTSGRGIFTCLDVGCIIASASTGVPPARIDDEDEARWKPPTYSAVAKTAPSYGNRSDSKTPLARHADSEKRATPKKNATSAVPIARPSNVHGECTQDR